MFTEWLPSITTWLVGLVTFLLTFNYIKKKSWRRLPPGPPALPLIGSVPFLPHSDARIAFNVLRERYGDIFTWYMGSQRVVVLNGLDLLKESLVKQGNAFLDRAESSTYEMYGEGHGLASANGARWLELRRVTQQILHKLGVDSRVFQDKIVSELEGFVRVLEAESATSLDPATLIKKSLSNVTLSMVYGTAFDPTDPLWLHHNDVIGRMLSKMANSGLLNVFPFLRFIPGDRFGLMAMKRDMDDLRRRQLQLLRRHEANYNVADEPTDFIESFLQKRTSIVEDPHLAYAERELLGVVIDLYTGGIDTTTATLSWAIIYLLRNQDIQEKVYREISSVIAQDELPQMDHKKNLPYTEACIAEIQRLGDIVPTGSPRATTEDVLIRGYMIPKGTMVLMNMNSVHMDAEHWPQPREFRPERFLDVDGKFKQNDALLPFSLGKRQCPAMPLGKMVIFMYFVALVKKFKFSPSPDHPLPCLDGHMGLTYCPNPYHVKIDARY